MPGYLRDVDKNKVQVQFETSDGRPAGKKWFDWGVVREAPVHTGTATITVVRTLSPAALIAQTL